MSLVDSSKLDELQQPTHLKRLFDLPGVDLVIDVGAMPDNTPATASRLTMVPVEPVPEMLEHLNAARHGDPDWYIEPSPSSTR